MPDASSEPFELPTLPGIKRDGTPLDGKFWTDGVWSRFQRGRARKIGGYKVISQYLSAISRGLAAYATGGSQYFYSGNSGGLDQVVIDPAGNVNLPTQRTPSAAGANGFVTSANNSWMFDSIYDSVSGLPQLIAHSPQNLFDPTNNVLCPIWAGPLYASTALVPITGSNIPVNAGGTSGFSGGVLALPPYLTAFGDNGLWACSIPQQPLVFTGLGSVLTAITDQKILRGLQLRGGGGAAPSALYWSLDSLILAQFNGGTTIFAFSVLSDQISVLSAKSIIEYDGTFYWAAQDRFMMFNGVVQELPNDMNINWFFDNLNPQNFGKVFAFKVPRYGEIWWCYPRGSNTECSHAVIYNVKMKTWYDTPLPLGFRTAACYNPNHLFGPCLSDAGLPPFLQTFLGAQSSNLWQHEYGKDQLYNGVVNAIDASITSSRFGVGDTPGLNERLTIDRIEPDMVSVGNVTITPFAQETAMGPVNIDPHAPYNVAPAPNVTSLTQGITPGFSGRLITLKFETNTQAGDYQLGKVLIHTNKMGERLTQ
jgi:hypothetical protein